VDATVLQGEVDHNVRQRFGVTRDDENFVIRQHVRVFAKQFPAPRNGDRFPLLFRTIGYVHGAPLERESRRFVLDGSRALARRYVNRRADVRVSADAGLEPASSAEALLRAVTGCEYDLCQAFRLARGEDPG
jgi:hypothetical protein